MVMFPFRLGRFHAILLLAMLTVDACLCKRGAGRNEGHFANSALLWRFMTVGHIYYCIALDDRRTGFV